MYKVDMEVCYADLHFIPYIMRMNKAHDESVGLWIEKDEPADRIRMGFDEDYSLGYTHSLSSYMSYFDGTVVRVNCWIYYPGSRG